MLYTSFVQPGNVFPVARNMPFKDMDIQMHVHLC